MSEQALIHLENIIKRYPQTVALNNVSLDFYPGEIHAVVGENGAGKSTLMNVIAGLCSPDSGSLYFDGQSMPVWNPGLSRRNGIAMVHQHFTLIPEITVAENILLAGGRRTSFILQKKAAAREITRLCKAYGLDIEPGARAESLSPGQKQRSEIIKALYYQCKVLILDEPTAVLTGGESQRLFAVLRQLAADGTAVILISHKLDEVFDVSSRITVLRQGIVAGRTKPGEMSVRQVAQLMTSGGENAASGGSDKAGSKIPVTDFARSFDGGHALEIRNLYAAGPDGRSGVAGISLSVDPGEVYGLAGVDGNGQSTLASAIMGIIPKTNKCRLKPEGVLFICGEDMTFASPGRILKRSVGYIPEDCQETGIVREMTLEENLILNSFSRERYGPGPMMDWGNVRREAVRAMCDMDIRAFSGKQTAGTLSGGNQQKLVVARELGKKPKLMLAVNPTRGIDANAAQKIRDMFLQARAEGCAILLISTDLDEILYLSDRIGVMYEGRLTAEFDGLPKSPPEAFSEIHFGTSTRFSGGRCHTKCERQPMGNDSYVNFEDGDESVETNTDIMWKEDTVCGSVNIQEQILRRQIGLAMAGHRKYR